jgi:hypothetical protein
MSVLSLDLQGHQDIGLEELCLYMSVDLIGSLPTLGHHVTLSIYGSEFVTPVVPFYDSFVYMSLICVTETNSSANKHLHYHQKPLTNIVYQNFLIF